MQKMSTITIIYSILVILITVTTITSANKLVDSEDQTILLISFDGFRYDYIQKYNLKNIPKLAVGGVMANALIPTFVTKTFPNHYTIVTGLYEESHGIIANYMYDPIYKEYFNPMTSSNDIKWWNNTVPIWVENEITGRHKDKNGKKNKRNYKSATIYWPGSEVTFNNKNISFTINEYDPTYTFKNRFDKIVDLLLEKDPVNFIAAYFEEPDKTGHKFGPDSKEMGETLKKLDDTFGYFLNKMELANLYKKVNIIVVSDHGMSTIKPNHVYTITDYTNPNDYDLIHYGTFLLINSRPGKRETVYKDLQKIPNLKVYYKEDIPEHYHYKHNRRVSEIFALAENGYYISPNKSFTKNVTRDIGGHGYSNTIKDMYGIFIAHGPKFKANKKLDNVRNIDLYELMCSILDIQPHPNNGTLKNLKSILKEKTLFTVIMKNPALIVILLSVCGIFIFVVILGCTISCYKNLKDSTKLYSSLDDQEVPLTRWDESNTEDEQMRRMR